MKPGSDRKSTHFKSDFARSLVIGGALSGFLGPFLTTGTGMAMIELADTIETAFSGAAAKQNKKLPKLESEIVTPRPEVKL
jgi:hypothetical protein